jgi:hypothetical protein
VGGVPALICCVGGAEAGLIGVTARQGVLAVSVMLTLLVARRGNVSMFGVVGVESGDTEIGLSIYQHLPEHWRGCETYIPADPVRGI